MAEHVTQLAHTLLPHIQATLVSLPILITTAVSTLTAIINDKSFSIADPVKTFPLVLLAWVVVAVLWSVVKSIGAWVKWLVMTLVWCSVFSGALYAYAVYAPTLLKMVEGQMKQ